MFHPSQACEGPIAAVRIRKIMDYSEQENSLNISTEELRELVQEEVGEQIEVQGRTNDGSDSVSYNEESKREDLDVRGSCNEDGSEVCSVNLDSQYSQSEQSQ